METTTVAMDSEEPSDRSQPKFMTLFISKNVYRTEIDKVEPKLWKFTCVSLILGHPVCLRLSVTLFFTFTKIRINSQEQAGCGKDKKKCFCRDCYGRQCNHSPVSLAVYGEVSFCQRTL